MDSNELEIERRLQASGASAPRLTPAHIDSVIESTNYWNPPGTSVTVCFLTLRNGFGVTGMSASASPENYNEQIGRDIAFKNAREQIWQLECYLLRQKLYEKS